MKLSSMLLWIIFVTAPSIIVSGYVVYEARGWLSEFYLIEISDDVYGYVLLVVMILAMKVSSNRILKQFFPKDKEGPEK